MVDVAKLYEAILVGDAKTSAKVVTQALKEDALPLELISNYMIPAMDEVGRRFDAHEYFYTELLLSARAMKAAFEPIRPLLVAGGMAPAGRIVIGTVEGDIHEIGKNLVACLLEGAGFEVMDLGVDVPPKRFVQAAEDWGAQIVAMSALLTLSMAAVQETVVALERSGLRDKVRVIIGGGGVTKRFVEQIGADGYGQNGLVAVAVARELISDLYPSRP